METEEKRIGMAWEEKTRHINDVNFYFKLQQMDEALVACEEILEEAGLGIGYVSKLPEIELVREQVESLWGYAYALRGYADWKVDTPLYKAFANGATEAISRIRAEDFEVDVTDTDIYVSQSVNHIDVNYSYKTTEKKKKLTFADFLGTQVGTVEVNGSTSVTTLNCVAGFAELFSSQYELMKGELTDDEGKPLTNQEYLEQLSHAGEFHHQMDKPVLSFLSGLLDITIAKPLIEAYTGEDLITKENLSEAERTLKAALAVLDLVTLGQAIGASGITKVLSTETLEQAGKVAVIELGTNAAGYTVNALGEQLELPVCMTLMLSMGSGITANRLLGKKMLGGQALEVAGEGGKYSAFGEMPDADGIKYSNWMKVREGELYIDYVQVRKELSAKLEVDGYKILKAEDATIANADWYDMGFDKPPVAENTIAYTVEAGNHSYSRVYLEGYNNPMSTFVVRTDEIAGLSAQEIAEKLALPKVPNKVVEVELPPSTPLEVSIVGPQPDWGTSGGDLQFAIKDVDLNPQWFTNIRDLE